MAPRPARSGRLGLVSGAAGRLQLVLVTDPGPDPDDVKAILIAGTLHKRGDISLRLVVANGGQQARQRARLARCLLDSIGCASVAVAIGSEGNAYEPVAHEYQLREYEAVDDARLEADAHGALVGVLQASRPKSVTIVCISSLRDLADVIAAGTQLVLERVARVCVQAGLEYSDRLSKWVPDTSVNNEFDRDAAAAVYDFCFGRGLPLTVVSRHAVPLLPMQLARSFAERTASPVMAYLANAQFLGLAGLWVKLCEGKLPARCTKQWYFETFCGVDRAQFVRQRFDRLDVRTDITPHLNGYVKPYDVVALMAVLPGTPSKAFANVTPSSFTPSAHQPHAAHRLYLTSEQAIEVQHVVRLLRNVYHDVVLATAPAAPVNRRLVKHQRKDRGELRSSTASGGGHGDGGAADESWSGPLHLDRSSEPDGLFDRDQIISLLEYSVFVTSARLQHVTRIAAVVGMSAFLAAVGVVYWTLETRPSGLSPEQLAVREVVGLAAFSLADLSIAIGVLALQPIASHWRVTTATAIAIIVATIVFAFPGVPQVVQYLTVSPEPSIARCGETVSLGWYRANGVRLALAIAVYVGFDLYIVVAWVTSRRESRVLAQTRRVRALWRACVCNLVLQSGPRAVFFTARCAVAQAEGLEPPPFLLPGLACIGAGSMVLYCLMLLPGSRMRAQALIARARCGRADGSGSASAQHSAMLETALAPMIGYGSVDMLQPSRVVPEALRVLCGIELNDEAFSDLRLGTSARTRARLLSSTDRDRESEVEGSMTTLTRSASSSTGGFTRRGLLGARLSHIVRHRGRASRLSRAALSTTSIEVDLEHDRALHPDAIDFYVLHSFSDPAQLRGAELRRWARTHRAERGRWPVVWLDAMCEDPLLERHERLAHEVVAMCRSRKMLCVIGPTWIQRLACIGRLLAWRAAGGTMDSVEVLIIGRQAAECRAIVAAIDAFHVVYAERDERPLLSAVDQRVLVHAIELAGAPQVNELVCALLPAVQQAAERAVARMAQGQDDVLASAEPRAARKKAGATDGTAAAPASQQRAYKWWKV